MVIISLSNVLIVFHVVIVLEVVKTSSASASVVLSCIPFESRELRPDANVSESTKRTR